MRDGNKAKAQLVEELADLSQRIAELEAAETERQRAEEALRESERLLGDAQEVAHIGSYGGNLKTGKGVWSEELYRIFGYSPGEVSITKEFVRDHIHPDDREMWVKANEALITSNMPYDVEYRIIRKDGEVRTVRSWATLRFDSSERTAGMLQDITERRQAELALEASEEKFRLLAEKSVVGIYIIQDSKMAYVNPSFAKAFGYSTDEIIGILSPKDLIHADDIQIVMKRLTERLVSETERSKIVYRAIRKDGSLLYIEVYGVLIEYQGKPAVMGTLIDVTKRKQAEERLQESEIRYRAVIDAQADILCCYTTDGKITFVNQAYCQFFGVTPEEMQGVDHFGHVPEEACQAVRDQLARLSAETPILTHENRNTDVQGESHWFLWSNQAILNDDGEIVEYQSVGRDITERKRIESKLKQNENMLRQIIDTTPNCIFVKDRNGMYLVVNKRMAELHSTTPEELVGKYDYEIAQKWFETADYNEFRKAQQDAIDNKKTLFIKEEPFVYHDGTERWFQTTKIPFELEDNQNCLLIISVDITGRKQAEEALRENEEKIRAILDASPDVIHLLDINGIILSSNEGFAKRAGLEIDDVVGKCAFDYAPPESVHNRKAALDKVFRTGKPLQLEDRGRTSVFKSHVHPVFNPEGEVTAVAVYARDITERKRAEEELRKHREHLEELIAERTAELRESEEKSRAQFKGIPVPTYTWQKVGEDLVLVDYNDAALEITQGGVANFVGTKATEMYRDRPEIRDELERCFAAKTTIEREMPYHYTTTGESKHLVVKYAFVPPDLVLVHTEDITPRVRAQEEIEKRSAELRKIVNAMAGREVRMAELKGVIRQLRAQLQGAGLTPVADDPLLAGRGE